jgi:excisionase family DNA binding protein
MADLIRPADVARRLAVSVRQVQVLACAGILPALKVGSVWRFDPTDLDAWVLQQKARSRRQPTYSIAATRGTRVLLSPASFDESAYERAISGKSKAEFERSRLGRKSKRLVPPTSR